MIERCTVCYSDDGGIADVIAGLSIVIKHQVGYIRTSQLYTLSCIFSMHHTSDRQDQY